MEMLCRIANLREAPRGGVASPRGPQGRLRTPRTVAEPPAPARPPRAWPSELGTEKYGDGGHHKPTLTRDPAPRDPGRVVQLSLPSDLHHPHPSEGLPQLNTSTPQASGRISPSLPLPPALIGADGTTLTSTFCRTGVGQSNSLSGLFPRLDLIHPAVTCLPKPDGGRV